jgi:hypothetical protein
MLIEFALDALHVTPGHVGLVIAWGMLYALFNGLQVRLDLTRCALFHAAQLLLADP